MPTDNQPAKKSRRSLRRMVRPIGIALAYISPHYAPYELRIKGVGRNRWAYLYKDGKMVWDCNGDFADANFEICPNGEVSRERPTRVG